MPYTDGDTVRCRVNSTIFGAGISLNIFTAQVEEVIVLGVSDDQMENVWEAYLDDIFSPLLDHISTHLTTNSFDLYKWDGAEWDWQSNAAYSPTYIGGASILPAGVSAVITAYTAINRVVGRKFFPGILEDSLLTGLWGSGLVADLALAAAQYISDFGIFPSLFVMHPGVYSSKVVDFVPFSLTALITNIPGYQRRRKTGVGD